MNDMMTLQSLVTSLVQQIVVDGRSLEDMALGSEPGDEDEASKAEDDDAVI